MATNESISGVDMILGIPTKDTLFGRGCLVHGSLSVRVEKPDLLCPRSPVHQYVVFGPRIRLELYIDTIYAGSEDVNTFFTNAVQGSPLDVLAMESREKHARASVFFGLLDGMSRILSRKAAMNVQVERTISFAVECRDTLLYLFNLMMQTHGDSDLNEVLVAWCQSYGWPKLAAMLPDWWKQDRGLPYSPSHEPVPSSP